MLDLARTITGGARMAEAALLDVLGSGHHRDPFAAHDPDYIRSTLDTMGLSAKTYFRGEVDGLEHILDDEPVLLVGNHSGGTLIADTFVFAHAFYEHFGPDRRFHQLAHDLVFKVPGVRMSLMRYGTVPANPRNMRRALSQVTCPIARKPSWVWPALWGNAIKLSSSNSGFGPGGSSMNTSLAAPAI